MKTQIVFEYSDTAKQHAIFVAGEFMGVAANLNVAALEEFLDYQATDEFRYHGLCRAAIEFQEIDRSFKSSPAETQPASGENPRAPQT